MTNHSDKTSQQREESNRTENLSQERQEQFNELSELPLEERMAVADQIGVPANLSGAVALGTANNEADAAEGSDERTENNHRGRAADR